MRHAIEIFDGRKLRIVRVTKCAPTSQCRLKYKMCLLVKRERRHRQIRQSTEFIIKRCRFNKSIIKNKLFCNKKQ